MDKIDDITEDELVAALFSARASEEVVEGALTTKELVKLTGRSNKWIHRQLQALMREARIEMVRVPMMDIAGRATSVPAYRLRDDESSRTDI